MQTTIEVVANTQAIYPECIKESKSNNRAQSLLWALIATVLFIIYYQQPDKDSTLGTIQILFVAFFAILAIVKLFSSSSRLTYTPTGSVVEKQEYNFNVTLKSDILRCLEEGDVARLRAFKNDSSGGLMVEMLSSQDQQYMAARALKYEPHGYVAITEWITLNN